MSLAERVGKSRKWGTTAQDPTDGLNMNGPTMNEIQYLPFYKNETDFLGFVHRPYLYNLANMSNQVHNSVQWRIKGRGLGGLQTPSPPPKFRSFDKVEPDCKLSGKCLLFLFQHPN